MVWWEWLIVVALPIVTATVVKGGPVVIDFLNGKAERDRIDRSDANTQRERFETELQNTINLLRARDDALERDIRECLQDRAKLQQQIDDLKAKV
jgi:predicted  nucleic acid-binding Zn-ribbon protein